MPLTTEGPKNTSLTQTQLKNEHLKALKHETCYAKHLSINTATNNMHSAANANRDIDAIIAHGAGNATNTTNEHQ
jgi:ABC-type sugar transport system substrate-binding protein